MTGNSPGEPSQIRGWGTGMLGLSSIVGGLSCLMSCGASKDVGGKEGCLGKFPKASGGEYRGNKSQPLAVGRRK